MKLYLEYLEQLEEARRPKFRKTLSSTVGLATGPLWLAYRMIRHHFDQCLHECGPYQVNTRKLQMCRIACKKRYKTKMDNLKRQIREEREAKKARRGK